VHAKHSKKNKSKEQKKKHHKGKRKLKKYTANREGLLASRNS